MTAHAHRILWATLLLGGLATGCDKGESATKNAEQSPTTPAATPKTKPAASPEAMAKREANKLFKQRCVVCHGKTGIGDGPGAAALTVKPRNYTDQAWQSTVTDDELKEIIVKGGAAMGKDPAMPATPALKKKPLVLDAMVAKIRSFAK